MILNKKQQIIKELEDWKSKFNSVPVQSNMMGEYTEPILQAEIFSKFRSIIEKYPDYILTYKNQANEFIQKYNSKDYKYEVLKEIAGLVNSLISDLKNNDTDSSDLSNKNSEEVLESDSSKSRNVFVVYGRNGKLKDEMFTFLRAIDLHPLDWDEISNLTGKPTPDIREILEKGFEIAQTFLVLFTPDEKAKLLKKFHKSTDRSEDQEGFQPRQNVLFEAGMAYQGYFKRTVFIQVGNVRELSDLKGLHILHLDNSPAGKQELVDRLNKTGCTVNEKSRGYLNMNFTIPESDTDSKEPSIY